VMLLLVDLVSFRLQYMKLYFLFYFKVVLDDPFVESNTCLWWCMDSMLAFLLIC